MKIVSPPKITHNILAYNKTHEYTRRVPTFRTPKQEKRDSHIVHQIVMAADVDCDASKALDIFFRKNHMLTNPIYWEVLRTVWVLYGSTKLADEFRPLFLSNRRAKSWFMTIEDTDAFNSMNFPITLYRAYDSEDDHGISWTSDKEWCEQYAASRGRKIKSSSFSKEQIYAYISRRGENEFIIL